MYGGTVEFAADNLVLDPDEILASTAAHQNHVVLLQVVALPRHVGHHLAAVAEANLDALPVGAVGLLGLADKSLQHNSLEPGFIKKGNSTIKF